MLANDSRVLRTGTIFQKISNCKSIILIVGDKEEEYFYNGNHVIVLPLPFWYPKKWCYFSEKYTSNIFFSKKILSKIFLLFVYLPLQVYLGKFFFLKIKEIMPDILWANDFETLSCAVAYKKEVRQVSLFYDSHEFWIESRRFQNMLYRITLPFVKIKEKIYFQYIDHAITVNQEIAAELTARYHPKNPVQIIYNIPQKNNDNDNNSYIFDIRERYCLSQDVKIIIYAGGLIRGRGIEFILDLSQNLLNYILFFIGSGSPDIIKKIRAKSNCLYHKPVLPEQLLSIIKQADIGLCPIEPICKSYYYALPNKFWEYVAAGLPVYASNLPSISRLILEHGIGYMYEVNDKASFLKNLSNFNINNELLHKNILQFNLIYSLDNEVTKFMNMIDKHMKSDMV